MTFLATTALHSFWNTNRKISFLGPWCLLSKDEHIWKFLDYEIMPSPWNDRDAYYKAGKYTYRLYQYLLDLISEYLNNIHDTRYTRRFWQIIIGPWLLNFIEVFYDRYYCLKKAFRRYFPVETILLDEKSYITPQDTRDCCELYCNDLYNLQLYSQIIRHFGISGPTKKYVRKDSTYIEHKGFQHFIEKCLYVISRYIASRKRIILWDMHLSSRYILKYILSSNFLASPVLFGNYFTSNYPIIADSRRLNLAKLPTFDEFTGILINNFPYNFPALYLEGFRDFLEKALSWFKDVPRVVMSAVGWGRNERLKFLAAYWAEKGTVLCGCQHGGVYGTGKWVPDEMHEIEISENYYTWGWEVDNKMSVKPLPNPRISKLRYRKIKYDLKGYFLFVGTCHPRYLYRLFSCPVGEMFDEYIEWRNIFLRILTPVNRKRILIRLYRADYDRAEKNRVLREFPDVRFDNYKRKFLSRLERSLIAVIDHPVTSMLEGLAMNHPTILFWNPRYWELREEAKPFFEELTNAGIWHKNPKSAAQFLNEVSNDVMSWWHNSKTQFAREKFVNQFAVGNRNWSKIWWSEMKKILKEAV
ncbi:MAG: hypothetical protein JRJ42_03675 [Deltaproteobacteria bacterium]|nr:hypothetical protein [Deltaproteobacteria bacterium]